MKELLTGVWYSFMPGIAVCAMLYPDFVAIPEWITQRNTRNRIKKLSVLDHLRKLFPTHHIVVIGKLTKDDKWEDGREFKAGSEWVLDANTRRLLWEEGKTDKKPDKVLAIIPAAGIGERFQSDIPKQYEYLDGQSVIEKSIKPFIESEFISKILIAVSKSDNFIKEQNFFDNKLSIIYNHII